MVWWCVQDVKCERLEQRIIGQIRSSAFVRVSYQCLLHGLNTAVTAGTTATGITSAVIAAACAARTTAGTTAGTAVSAAAAGILII